MRPLNFYWDQLSPPNGTSVLGGWKHGCGKENTRLRTCCRQTEALLGLDLFGGQVINAL
jgi:hypothetical protein